MQALVRREPLTRALKQVKRAALSGKNARLPILTGALLTALAGENALRVSTTNLSVWAEMMVPAQDVRRTGQAVVDCAFLLEIIEALDNDQLWLEAGERFSISSGHMSPMGRRVVQTQRLKTMEVSDFPQSGEDKLDPGVPVIIKTEVLKELIVKTVWARQSEKSGYYNHSIYANLLLRCQGNTLSCSASNGVVAVTRSYEHHEVLPWQGELLIYGKDMEELAKILDPALEEEVRLSVSSDRLIVSSSSLLLFVRRNCDDEERRVKEDLFNPDKLLPQVQPVGYLTIERAVLTKALAGLKREAIEVTLSYEHGELVLSLYGDDSGRICSVPAQLEGEWPFQVKTYWGNFKTAVGHFHSRALRIGLTMLLSLRQGYLPDPKGKTKKAEAKERAITLLSCNRPKEDEKKDGTTNTSQ